jgi:hypothetical protein
MHGDPKCPNTYFLKKQGIKAKYKNHRKIPEPMTI